MMLPIILRPQAEADVMAARDWYASQTPELGAAFAESVHNVFLRIQAMPQMYAVAFRDVRRGGLRRFPYVIYYRVLSDRIEVIAILHARRDPKLWQERVN
jgi:plasmid stabilization system protein ParE